MFDSGQISKDYTSQVFSETKAISYCRRNKRRFSIFREPYLNLLGFLALVIGLILIANTVGSKTVAAQTVAVSPSPFSSPMPTATPYVPAQSNAFTAGTGYSAPTNYLKNSAAFRQEIARMEINVVRGGKYTLPITEVPRVQKDDVIRVRLLEEAINGIKPDQSNWDWTLLIAYVNPSRNLDKEKSVSEEVRFRKTGWYREYFFKVPFDSQPIFFLYPKPKYREKILKVVSRKYEEIQKLGDKTIEIAGAYAHIGSFLNELQGVLARTQASAYGTFVTYPNLMAASRTSNQNLSSVGGNLLSGKNNQFSPIYNYNAFLEQTIERLAQSFNIQLPSCWQTASGNISYNGYGIYSRQNNFGYGVSQDMIGRAQCVAKNIRIEDFDLSVASMLKQGGIFALTQLRDRYPQLAYWINIAAAAVDFIVKAFQKTPLKIVPTITSTNGNSSGNFQNAAQQNLVPHPVKISLYAESQPSEQGAVTAYPIVIQKWQSDEDSETIHLPPPALLEPCLHVGQNILKNTNLAGDLMADPFVKNLKLILSAKNGFKKEFSLKSNVGLGGWELNIKNEDLSQLPKAETLLEAEITGTRGFNEIASPKFVAPVSFAGAWQIKAETQKDFTIGEKRKVILRNSLGSCRCLQSVIYKPSSGKEFVFNADSKGTELLFSGDGKEVSFEIDAASLSPGQGQLEIKTYGSQATILPIKLYPLPPDITDLKIAKGNNEAVVSGQRLEQLQFIIINGKKAKPQPSVSQNESRVPNQQTNQKVFVFEDANARHFEKTVSLELGLEDERIYKYPKTFGTLPARPAVAANELNEIEVTVADSDAYAKSQFDLSSEPVIPVETKEIFATLQNKLTDYEFRPENLSIETRIEKSSEILQSVKAGFEVLDSNTLRVNFTFDELLKKTIGGRRLQFRIRDKERGNSDWFIVRQTFIRMPEIASIKCPPDLNGECRISGKGLGYISQFSGDGGATWFPQDSDALKIQTTGDGQESATIKGLSDKNPLLVKLRDFPKTTGFRLKNYKFNGSEPLNFLSR